MFACEERRTILLTILRKVNDNNTTLLHYYQDTKQDAPLVAASAVMQFGNTKANH